MLAPAPTLSKTKKRSALLGLILFREFRFRQALMGGGLHPAVLDLGCQALGMNVLEQIPDQQGL